MKMKLIKHLLALLALTFSLTTQAVSQNNFNPKDLPHFHRENLPVKPDEILLTRSCEELDEAITYLIPSTYQYKPDFYDDQYNGAAIWGSTIVPGVALVYLPYSWFIGYQEEDRQHQAFYEIEKLRHAKAIKHCYAQ